MNSSNAIESGSIENARTGNLHIVVIDDSLVVREHVVDSLSAINGVAAVRQACDVSSGLALLEAHQPDVMVLDIEMPGQSGLDLLKIVRSRNTAVVVIMFSIYDHPQLRQRCKDLGANYYFHKLKEFERVAEVCRDLAEQRARQIPPSSLISQE